MTVSVLSLRVILASKTKTVSFKGQC